MPTTLSAIHIFPIKSCAPLTLEKAEVESRGLAHDRRWVVTDTQHRALTGRQHPRLTLMHARPDGDGLIVSAPQMPDLKLVEPRAAERIDTKIWSDTVAALPARGEADAWISAFLGVDARLKFMDEVCVREVERDFAQAGDAVSFADGFPLLLISEASLDALNARLATPVSMLRFRPNLVVAGTDAHDEDRWKRIRIGAVELDLVKPCARCVFTTVDFESGTFDPAGEPLRTLITYRRSPHGVTFGQNVIARSLGEVRVGDAVEVLE